MCAAGAAYRCPVSAGSSDDWTAELAAEYIAATLGVEVDRWDRCSRQGAHDLRYEQAGRSVAVEVKEVVGQDLRQMDRAIEEVGYVVDSLLTRLWVVHLRHGAHIGRARAGLPVLLAQLEQRGWTDRLAWRQARSGGLGAVLDELWINGLWSQEPTPQHPGGFALLPEPQWQWDPQIPTLPAFIGDLLADDASALVQKLRRQLGAAATDERHAFLFLGWEHAVAWPLMTRGGDLPVDPPRLPPLIDGVWIATFSPDTRVLAWLPQVGWIEGRRNRNAAGPDPSATDGSESRQYNRLSYGAIEL